MSGSRDDLAAAAAVHAAHRDVVQAIAALAVSPLDEQLAEQMRRALTHSSSVNVREALKRVTGPARVSTRPVLVSLPTGSDVAGEARDAQLGMEAMA